MTIFPKIMTGYYPWVVGVGGLCWIWRSVWADQQLGYDVEGICHLVDMIFSMIIARSFNKTWSESRLMINSIASHRITLLMILMIIMKMIHHHPHQDLPRDDLELHGQGYQSWCDRWCPFRSQARMGLNLGHGRTENLANHPEFHELNFLEIDRVWPIFKLDKNQPPSTHPPP